jgi:hypothetical protein
MSNFLTSESLFRFLMIWIIIFCVFIEKTWSKIIASCTLSNFFLVVVAFSRIGSWWYLYYTYRYRRYFSRSLNQWARNIGLYMAKKSFLCSRCWFHAQQRKKNNNQARRTRGRNAKTTAIAEFIKQIHTHGKYECKKKCIYKLISVNLYLLMMMMVHVFIFCRCRECCCCCCFGLLMLSSLLPFFSHSPGCWFFSWLVRRICHDSWCLKSYDGKKPSTFIMWKLSKRDIENRCV